MVCENPTYTGLWNVFESPGVRLIGVPVTPEGMDLDALESVLEQTRVKLIFCSPTFQNPTGFTMPLAARQRLLELALRFQVPIVEDDVYGALRYRGRQIPPLKALDSAGLVIYLNSFSKVGFPGLRVGWLVASRPVIERLRWAKQRADLHTNLLGQAVLQELGVRGWLDKWIRKTCKVYAHKQDVLRRAIERHFPPGGSRHLSRRRHVGLGGTAGVLGCRGTAGEGTRAAHDLCPGALLLFSKSQAQRAAFVLHRLA